MTDTPETDEGPLLTSTILRLRDDGDYDHIEVYDDGSEVPFAVVPAEDYDFPYGRPTQEQIDAFAGLIRAQRTSRLEETDWWASPEFTMTDEQRAYRQALRDLPDHPNWPYLNRDDWPTKP